MEYFKCFVNLETEETDVCFYFSALNADIGDKKCGTVMIKLVFFITNYSYDSKIRVIR